MTTQTSDLRAQRIPGEAARLVELAGAQSLTLRVTGSVAVHLLCHRNAGLLTRLGRRPYRDIDFWALGRDHSKIITFFESEGYAADPQSLHLRDWGIKRLIFEHPDTGIKVDVFMDELVMAHTIPFADRLRVASPCVSPADLLLSKLQIHEITANDLIDLTVLLVEHELGDDEPGRIAIDRIGSVLGSDWGFWYESLQNLRTLLETSRGYTELPAEAADLLSRRVDALRERIEDWPKSRRWRIRSRIGTRKRWYEQVSELDSG